MRASARPGSSSPVQLVIKLGEGDVTFVAGNSCFAFTLARFRELF